MNLCQNKGFIVNFLLKIKKRGFTPPLFLSKYTRRPAELMATYHIKKKASLTDDDIYFVGGVNWTDDYSKRKKYTSKASVEAVLVNTDGTNGGFNFASYVKE